MGEVSTSVVVLDHSSLVRLRWGGVVGLGLWVALGFVGVTQPILVWVAVLAVVVSVAGNLGLARWPQGLPFAFVADTWVITALLAASGGASNPFTLLLLMPVVLGAMSLPLNGTLLVALSSIAGFAALFTTSPSHMHHMDMSQHLVGMFMAFAVTVPMLVFTVYRFRSAITNAESQQRLARQATERAERLAALAALAGGAAHELADPLSTILLVSKELTYSVKEPGQRDDLELIVEEVERCRTVLRELSAEVGATTGELWSEVALPQLLRQATNHNPRVIIEADSCEMKLPSSLIVQALRRLVGNALDASEGSQSVTLKALCDREAVRFQVVDEGKGMSEAELKQAAHAFYSTKASGMGLGLFFVHSVAHQLGGELQLSSQVGKGTSATLVIPRQRASSSA